MSSVDPRVFMLDPEDSPSGTAALALVGALVGMLFKAGRLSPDEATAVAAMAAAACREGVHPNAVALIEGMFPDCRTFDLAGFAAENDIEIEMATKQ